MVRSKHKFNAKPLLAEFAEMCRKSKEWQGDGWGIAWQDDEGLWHGKKSLSPIWQSRNPFKDITNSKIFVVHARSASFKEQRGSLSQNQPFIKDGLAFVFNGFLHGVNLHVSGETGAEKLFNLLQREIKARPLSQILQWLQKIVRKNTKKVMGCNIGLTDGKKLAVLCDFDEDEEYYTLCYHRDKDVILVCSEPLQSYQWQKMKRGQVKIFRIQTYKE